MNERLWSPAMRKWANDAHRHGIDIGLTKHRPSRQDYFGGAGLPYTTRVADDGGIRVIDVSRGDRKIDRPVL